MSGTTNGNGQHNEDDLLGQLLKIAADTAFVAGDVAHRQARLEQLVRTIPDIELAYGTDGNGIQNVPNVQGPGIQMAYDGDGTGADRSGRAWFNVPSRLKRPFTSKKLFSLATNRLCVTVSVPLFDADGAFAGVLAADIAVNE